MVRKYKNFLQWYYGEGLKVYMQAAYNVLIFLPSFFSFRLLSRTLFLPWHRDVSLRSWQGFQPLRSLQILLWNIFSRAIGLLVRISTLLLGVMCTALFCIVAIIGLMIYCAWPGLLIASIILLISGQWAIACVALTILFLAIMWAYLHYRQFFHKSYAKMDIISLTKQPWFHRVWERFGIREKDVPKKSLTSLEHFKQFLKKHELSVEEAQDVIAWEMKYQSAREEMSRPFSKETLSNIHPIGRLWHYGYTLLLNRFSHDLSKNDFSSYGREKLHGHKKALHAMEIALAKPEENSVLLVGDEGVGRTMLVHALAEKVRNGSYGGGVIGEQRILQADLVGAVASARERGRDVEFVVQSYFHEAAFAGNVTLYLENFEQYFAIEESHREVDFSYSALLQQYMPYPHFRMIATVTEDAFQSLQQTHSPMLTHFSVIHVQEMTSDEAIKTLFTHFYDRSQTVFTYQALREIVVDSGRYTNTGPLPARALTLATEVRTDWRQSGSAGFVTPEIVQKFITQKTGIPLGQITEKAEQQKLLSLEDRLSEQVIAQPRATHVIASALKRMRSGIARPNRPAASFLFMGPTGVGKTEMAKVVAGEYFGKREKIARIDMSEFTGRSALSKLIGSRETGEKGILTDMVTKEPYGVLLLDEIEKADSAILDVFLQILDEGFAHNGFGRKLHFTSMIVIATSNAGSRTIAQLGETAESKQLQERVLGEVVADGTFRQEFLNRFDDVIVFDMLDVDSMEHITGLMLEKFAARVAQEQNITVTFDGAIQRLITQYGYEPKNGARSILRYIDKTLSDALATKLITGDTMRGSEVHFTEADLHQK